MKVPVEETVIKTVYDETALDHNIDLYKQCDFDQLFAMISKFSAIEKLLEEQSTTNQIRSELVIMLYHQVQHFRNRMRHPLVDRPVKTGITNYEDRTTY